MQELQQLSEKLNLLIKRFNSLKAENEQLKKRCSQQTKQLETLHKKESNMEQAIAALQIAKGLSRNEDNAEVRKALDLVISSIDNILTSLDD